MTEQQANPQPQGQPQDHYPPPQPPPPRPVRRLTRTSWDAPISGVCGGFARYLGVDPTLVRVLAVILAVVTFPAFLIAYVVAWILMPKE